MKNIRCNGERIIKQGFGGSKFYDNFANYLYRTKYHF